MDPPLFQPNLPTNIPCNRSACFASRLKAFSWESRATVPVAAPWSAPVRPTQHPCGFNVAATGCRRTRTHLSLLFTVFMCFYFGNLMWLKRTGEHWEQTLLRLGSPRHAAGHVSPSQWQFKALPQNLQLPFHPSWNSFHCQATPRGLFLRVSSATIEGDSSVGSGSSTRSLQNESLRWAPQTQADKWSLGSRNVEGSKPDAMKCVSGIPDHQRPAAPTTAHLKDFCKCSEPEPC